MIKELNRVMEYIEAHLCDDELSLEKISAYAGISDYHFRKVFYYLSGITLSDYIKYRRLSEASAELLNGAAVTDLAYKYGYRSLDGFSRAFKSWCDVLPSEVKRTGMSKSFPKLNFIIRVEGGNPMEFRIVNKPAFCLAGVSKRVPMQFEGINQEIVKLAESITDAQKEEMHALQDIEPREIVNASFEADANFLKEEGELTHLIGVLTTATNVSDSLETVPVAAGTWAVFPNEGPFPATMQNTMAKVYSEWLPASDYEVLNAPTFSFTKMNAEKADHAYSEIWIPVAKR